MKSLVSFTAAATCLALSVPAIAASTCATGGPRNAVATADQYMTDTAALAIVNSPEVKRTIGEISSRMKQLAQSDESRAAVDQAVTEFAGLAAYTAVLSGNPAPRISWFYAPPHTWGRHKAAGTRVLLDNPDNLYRSSILDDAGEYRIVICPRPGEEATSLIAMLQPYMMLGDSPQKLDSPVGILTEKEFVRAADGSITITIDRAPANGRENHIQSRPGARHFVLRETFADWASQSPAYVRISRLDPGVRGKPASTAKQIEHAVALLKTSERSMVDFEHKIVPLKWNALTMWVRPGSMGGAAMGRYRLAADEGLVITLDPMGAKYLGIQLGAPWYPSLPVVRATGSLTNLQSVANPDGTYTYVISATDPGAANWLDTSGTHEGSIMPRWQGIPGPLDAARAVRAVTVRKLSDIAHDVTLSAAPVSAAQRAQHADRRAAAYRRRCDHICTIQD